MKIQKKHGMIFLTILLLSSSLTAFMTKPVSNVEATIIVKFSDYEVYETPAVIDDNTTLLQAVSGFYYIKLENNTLKCVRNSCNDNESVWLAFNERGIQVQPETRIVQTGEKLYLIYNQTTQSNVEEDVQAIRDLLQL